jgi:hypothetical protein
MKSAKRWSLAQILSAGNVYASDNEGTGNEGQQTGATGGTGQPDPNATSTAGAGGTGDKPKEGEEEFTPEQMRSKIRALQEEQERHFKERKKAEAERDELRKVKDEADRKDKSELENAKADLEARDKALAAKDETIKRLTVENAFMGLKEIEWHNPARALSLVDLSEVEFDPETGKVKNVKEVLKAAKALADSDSYLVKAKTAPPNGTPNGTGTGKPPAGSTQQPDEKSKDALRAKYNINR